MLRMTEEQAQTHLRRVTAGRQSLPAPKTGESATKPAEGAVRYKSKWERQYAHILALRRIAGDILSWHYEPMSLRLDGGIRYSPDFLVVTKGGQQLHEVKGRMREAARIKLRQAVEIYSGFDWFIVGKDMAPRRLKTPADVPSVTR